MNRCYCGAAYIGAERACLRQAIAENRAHLSEQLGSQVDERVAMQDFLEHVLEVFSRQFNVTFCGACPYRDRCQVNH